MTMADLLRLSWGWSGPALAEEPGCDPHFELRIAELPDFFVAGRSREEVLAASQPALKAFLQSYLDHGEEPPLPANQTPSWIVGHVVMPPQHAIPAARPPGEALLIAS